MSTYTTDVVVVGAGNAAMCAAHAARETGKRVRMVEAAPKSRAGGNSYFTAGATRITHEGLESLKDLVEPDERHSRSEVPPYSKEDYAADLKKVTLGRNDPDMTELLTSNISADMRWLKTKGMRYRLMYERQAYETSDGGYLFWGGLHVGNVDGGEGLMRDHLRIAEATGIEILYEARAVKLLAEDGTVTGVAFERDGEEHTVRAGATVLGSGGFEASKEMRAEHLGAEWHHAVTRGTPFNTGTMLQEALRLDAAKGGDWSSCHATQWDAGYEDNESNYEVTNRLTRQSYPLGIIVDRHGKRFLDEGADFRNLTYAKYGKEVLMRPGAIAWQIFDAPLRPMLRPQEYEVPGVGEHVAGSLQELAEEAGIDPGGLAETVESFNTSIDISTEFDPNVKDGRAARTEPPKSNWANRIAEPPFYAYPVTCGITFTFGGLKGDAQARVLKEDGSPIPGLFACGETLGGLFSENYPGGSGLAAGIVFGRIAGRSAAA
ncbi:tricarballylate dehydrogenase [Saccharomonospora sp. CUA-673]|uniref:FAD-dependent tricarballylate dehydrogenase TcuA n=1 Tax=Saccharomonospora sp. CUA-673 TaxID=1904969 RepID=UPI00095EEADC|nr:FAD-dependent tricarballylate dehydrogenase TcuA [Saccharomonospora sp. CUA-673]OLT49188.1 tricarballylate dehydrogenase [Saccharomonospora sp. CUA-673]